MLKEMPLREGDSSGRWKSISTISVFPGVGAPTIGPRMVKAQRVAIVTGASEGIGGGLGAGYPSLGFGVVATSRSIAPSGDEQVLAIPGDIRDRATAHKVLAAAKERFGRVDTL